MYILLIHLQLYEWKLNKGLLLIINNNILIVTWRESTVMISVKPQYNEKAKVFHILRSTSANECMRHKLCHYIVMIL